MESHSLDVRCLLQPQPNHADWWHVLVHPMQAQLEWLPLSRQSYPAGLASAQWPPVLPGILLSPEQVGKLHGHVTNDWVLQEVSIVNDLDCYYRCLFISAQEFCGRLPHGIVRVLKASRSMGWGGMVAQINLDERVEIA